MDEALTQVAISLPNRLLAKIENASQLSGQSRSRIVRDLVELALNQEPGLEVACLLKSIPVKPAPTGRGAGERCTLEGAPNMHLLPQKLVLFSENLDDIDIVQWSHLSITGSELPIPASLFSSDQKITIPIKREIIVPGTKFTLVVSNKTTTPRNLWGFVIGRGSIKKPEYW